MHLGLLFKACIYKYTCIIEGSPKLRVSFFGRPYTKGQNILGSTVGPSVYGNPQRCVKSNPFSTLGIWEL